MSDEQGKCSRPIVSLETDIFMFGRLRGQLLNFSACSILVSDQMDELLGIEIPLSPPPGPYEPRKELGGIDGQGQNIRLPGAPRALLGPTWPQHKTNMAPKPPEPREVGRSGVHVILCGFHMILCGFHMI